MKIMRMLLKQLFTRAILSYFNNNCEVVYPKEIIKRTQNILEIVIKYISWGCIIYKINMILTIWFNLTIFNK